MVHVSSCIQLNFAGSAFIGDTNFLLGMWMFGSNYMVHSVKGTIVFDVGF